MNTTDPLYTLTVTTPDGEVHEHGPSDWWTCTVNDRSALTCRADDEDDTCTAQHIYAAGNWASCHVEKVEPQRVSKSTLEVPLAPADMLSDLKKVLDAALKVQR